ncbi:2Fe-2S iron-sulfur cluster-binding protein [Pseudomonas alvandae]|uniref:(2Fe-2S)-binding protein n=1 Tax=Pseudomonas canavaninivorans TaxID=2842348 RepID=A0ABX8QLS4_PSECO|nr:2Fe-2S iron-sulfur cluster-binding protein [Pseudomonas alvandae]QXI55959.1 (2Fe-2S)-binding protein [Pseudomonas alvandae]
MSVNNQCCVEYNGRTLRGKADQPLIDFLAEQGIDLPHVCYHRALGPIQTCGVCWIEHDGEMVRGCTWGFWVFRGKVKAESPRE